jgi:hypothetical protein
MLERKKDTNPEPSLHNGLAVVEQGVPKSASTHHPPYKISSCFRLNAMANYPQNVSYLFLRGYIYFEE